MDKPFITVPVVAAVVMKKDGKYLMIQEKQPRAYMLWNVPAGKVDVGETLEEAAVREAKEESGFDVKLIRKLGLFQNISTEPPKHVYEGEIIGGSLAYPEDEIMDAQWMAFDEIQAKAAASQLRGSWILDVLTNLEKDVTQAK